MTHLRSFRVTHGKTGICRTYAWWVWLTMSSAPKARSGNMIVFIMMRGDGVTCHA
jgi:hypothetical protein